MKVLNPIQSPRGFVILPVHYSHDPEKDSAWVTQEQLKYMKEYGDWEKEWQLEEEINFQTVPGALAYPAFSSVNIGRTIYNKSLPLCLDCDFNVEPMVWEVSQQVGDIICFIDEIKISPAQIKDMVTEFRNRYPAHPGELWIYGDATGNKRTSQTATSDYDLIRLYFRGYPSPRVFKISSVNPAVKDRINAVNLRLRAVDGQPGVLIDESKCPELIRDFKEVAIKDAKIVKTSKKEDPYFWRTHASDAAGYHIFREFPVVSQVYEHARKKRKPLKYKRLLGVSGL
jgi:hypothetical protein